MDLDLYEWRNVKAVDIAYWAARREGWKLLQIIHSIGDELAVIYRERKADNGALSRP